MYECVYEGREGGQMCAPMRLAIAGFENGIEWFVLVRRC